MYNQPPLWIINSTLFIFFVGMLFFVGFTRYKVPARTQLKASYAATQPLKDVSKIDISRIYRNDLFNTYKETSEQPQKVEEKKLQLPTPPAVKPAITVETRPVQFLEPLAITLKGIMFSSDEQYNRVVIQDNKSNAEKLYKVGDAVEDAEIVRIYYNKVMLIRSNGQQETLFVTPQEAQKDPQFKHDISWQNCIQQKSPTEFVIDKEQFMQSVRNLTEFIDMLDITTAFKKGKSVGCRIGVLKPASVGQALGLVPNDIILTIADIPTITTNDRVEIFTHVKNMSPHESVAVKILRNGSEITQNYQIAPEIETTDSMPQATALPAELQHMHDMSNQLVLESHTSKNPMVEQVHKDNFKAMTEKAPAPAQENISSSSLLQQVPT